MELKVREFLENNLGWGLLVAIDGMAAKLSLLIIGRFMEEKKKRLWDGVRIKAPWPTRGVGCRVSHATVATEGG